jgi:DNA processing protein
LITNYPLGTTPDSKNFPARNRITSGLALATVVVESLDAGGSLITAKYALEQGRDVMAVPGDIFSAYSRGTNELIKNGAQSVTSAEEIMARLEEIRDDFARNEG